MNRLLTHVVSLGRGLFDAVAPQTCAACAGWIPGERGLLCAICRAEIERLAGVPACPRCARTVAPVSMDERGCFRCRRESFWNVAGVVRCGEYVEPFPALIRGLKYAGRQRNADVLGDLMADALRRRGWTEIDVLVPVPMHWVRRVQRSCDHALLLARAIGRRLRVPVRREAVRRVRHGPSQTEQPSLAARFANVEDCFGPRRRPGVAGKTVCIVDNLLVSGATVHELSKVLRRAGARRIVAVVAARAVPPGHVQAQAAVEEVIPAGVAGARWSASPGSPARSGTAAGGTPRDTGPAAPARS